MIPAGHWDSVRTYCQMLAPEHMATHPVEAPAGNDNMRVEEALRQKLANARLPELETLMFLRGIRTLNCFENLTANDRNMFLTVARKFYDPMEIPPGHLNHSLNKLFFGEGHGGPWRPDQLPWGPQQANPMPPEPLMPMDDDSLCRREFGPALLGAREIIGTERYTECLRRLQRSEELAMAAAVEQAEAMAVIQAIRREDVRDRDRKEALKRAKKACRDKVIWRCLGVSEGFEREGVVRVFEGACRHVPVDENTVSQLSNGYRRIREELAGGQVLAKMRTTEPSHRNGQEGAGSGSQDAAPPPAPPPAVPASMPASSLEPAGQIMEMLKASPK